ncbi:uncharacterized protein LOC141903981 [Tubulanus polymorphus]|uniref:uncharacterized protein LOC141903981 n=1 Tax=Tubulanus polymorphus TaxID=672921 RepID=UPI003DA1D4FE
MADKIIEKLRKENESLNSELEETKSLHEQLLNERKNENYEEWRVLLLKSQLIQMERQNLILSESLASRSNTLLEIENSLSKLADSWRVYIAKDIHGPDVPVPRGHIMKMVEVAESTRLKISKTVANTSAETLAKPALIVGEFVKPDLKENGDVSLLDVCSGNLDHINLKHVSKLETKLFSLFKRLTSLEYSFRTVCSSGLELGAPVYEHTYLRINETRDALKDINQDLLNLSVLVPAAPWPALQKSKYLDLTVANVMSKFPKLTPKYRQQLKDVVTAAVKSMNYSVNASGLETRAIERELEFHREIYELEIEYVDSLFAAVETSYEEFRRSAREFVCLPIRELLEKYAAMKTTPSDETLKTFLTAFKENAEIVSSAVEQMEQTGLGASSATTSEADGSPMRQYGLNFLDAVERAKSDCRRKRDAALVELDGVKREREIHRNYLQQLLQNDDQQNAK